jgi:histidyl-tRNA synthetase
MTEREPLPTEPYKGVRDFYPADWAVLSSVFATLRTQLGLWGYEEYAASPLERAELYEAKTSEEIVSEQTYTFEDRGGRRVTLRPEMTPSLARMVAAKRRELPLPLRWFSIGNRFRYERPQRGRSREFFQADVDLLGILASDADLEVVTLADRCLKAFGATGTEYEMRINSRKLLTAACEAAGLSADATKTYLRLLDKKDKIDAETFSAGVAELTATDPLSLIENDDARIAPFKTELLAQIAELKARGVESAVFSPTLTRGFDYYTGLTFEAFDTHPDNPRAILGGGRYDRLLELFGSELIPAVGFAIGVQTLMDFLETHTLTPSVGSPADIYLGTPTEQDIPAAETVAELFRKQGVRSFVNLTGKSLGDQVKDADRRGIPYFAAYGFEERDSGLLKVKELSTGTVSEVGIDEATRLILRK